MGRATPASDRPSHRPQGSCPARVKDASGPGSAAAGAVLDPAPSGLVAPPIGKGWEVCAQAVVCSGRAEQTVGGAYSPGAIRPPRGWGACPTPCSPSVYQLRVRGVSPLIWRRLLNPADMTIAGLHAMLQIAFGWRGTHLHRFVVHGRECGIASTSVGPPQARARAPEVSHHRGRRRRSRRSRLAPGDEGVRHDVGVGLVELKVWVGRKPARRSWGRCLARRLPAPPLATSVPYSVICCRNVSRRIR